MLEAVATDFLVPQLSPMTVHVALDHRLTVEPAALNRFPILQHPRCQINWIRSSAQLQVFLAETGAMADAIFLIAPEIDRHLERLRRELNSVIKKGAKWLTPSADVIRLGSDKWETFQFLSNHSITTPLTFRNRKAAREWVSQANPSTPETVWIEKPRFGAGSVGVKEITLSEMMGPREPANQEPTNIEEESIFQLKASGVPASIAALCCEGSGDRLVMNAGRQIFKSGTLEYAGCETPLSDGFQLRAERLLDQVLNALPPFTGYLGIDILFGDQLDGSLDYVIEINPRMTTSYCDTRRNCKQNPMEWLLNSNC